MPFATRTHDFSGLRRQDAGCGCQLAKATDLLPRILLGVCAVGAVSGLFILGKFVSLLTREVRSRFVFSRKTPKVP